jgi:hypothetical protein
VVFFMPRWLDSGQDLPAYMAEVLEGLGLALNRIRILLGPTRMRHLLIPAQCWGGSTSIRAPGTPNWAVIAAS